MRSASRGQPPCSVLDLARRGRRARISVARGSPSGVQRVAEARQAVPARQPVTRACRLGAQRRRTLRPRPTAHRHPRRSCRRGDRPTRPPARRSPPGPDRLRSTRHSARRSPSALSSWSALSTRAARTASAPRGSSAQPRRTADGSARSRAWPPGARRAQRGAAVRRRGAPAAAHRPARRSAARCDWSTVERGRHAVRQRQGRERVASDLALPQARAAPPDRGARPAPLPQQTRHVFEARACRESRRPTARGNSSRCALDQRQPRLEHRQTPGERARATSRGRRAAPALAGNAFDLAAPVQAASAAWRPAPPPACRG